MQAILLVIVIVALVVTLMDYKPLSKRIEEADNNPNNSIKSDKWKREHGIIK
jgi:hypothetical protein